MFPEAGDSSGVYEEILRVRPAMPSTPLVESLKKMNLCCLRILQVRFSLKSRTTKRRGFIFTLSKDQRRSNKTAAEALVRQRCDYLLARHILITGIA
jgi:hypothetical protein